MIVGTAGHIDHGKTALIRALTGIDTDRLPEERERGITIELGFAPLRIDNEHVISMVDVPGHEALVRTMVAGASGIDAALVVVAADEGIMPQTREHLRVLTALDVRLGVVALTKCDLVDAEWIALVVDEIRSAVAGSSIAGAAIIPTSTLSGEGIDAIRDALASLAPSVSVRPTDDLFRYVVDRAFTIKGTGTVVTGTVWSGKLDVGARVTLLPGGATSRVRAIHSHGEQLSSAIPGRRCAVALSDVTPAAVPRGTQLVTHAAWTPTRYLCADVRLLAGHAADKVSDNPAARSWRRDLMFYVAGAEARARVAWVTKSECVVDTAVDTAEDDEIHRVRIILDRPVVTRRGDRFVLRSVGPADTVGGGVIVDPMPARGARGAWDAGAETPAERLRALLAAAGTSGIAARHLPVRLGVAPAAVGGVVQIAGAVVLGANLFEAVALDRLTEAVAARAAERDRIHTVDGGIHVARLREELRSPPEAVDLAIARLCESGQVTVRDGLLLSGDGQPSLTTADGALLARLLHRLFEAAAQPPSVAELTAEFGERTEALLRYAVRCGNLVDVESVRYYDARVVLAQIGRMRGAMAPGTEYSPPELRDMLGVSRKYLIPFLEYCDRAGVTERRPSGRAIRGISSR